MVQDKQQPGKMSQLSRTATAKHPPVGPIFGRTVALLVCFALALFAAYTLFASSSIAWLVVATVDDSSSRKFYPITECPSETFPLFSNDYYLDGPHCKVHFRYSPELVQHITNNNLQGVCDVPASPHEGKENGIVCKVIHSSCRKTCTASGGGVCPNSSNNVVTSSPSGIACQVDLVGGAGQQLLPYYLDCNAVVVSPYCDREFTVTPSNVVAMRSLIIACLFICLVWFSVEWVLFKADWDLRKESATGMAEQTLRMPELVAEEQVVIRERWLEEKVAVQMRRRRISEVYCATSTVDQEQESVASSYPLDQIAIPSTSPSRALVATRQLPPQLDYYQVNHSHRVTASCPSPRSMQGASPRGGNTRQLSFTGFTTSPTSSIRGGRAMSIYSQQSNGELENSFSAAANGGATTNRTTTAADDTMLYHNSFVNNHTAIASADPTRRFTSTTWKNRLGEYRDLQALRKSMFRSRASCRTFALSFFYFSLLVGTLLVLLELSPDNIQTATSSSSVVEVFKQSVQLWQVHGYIDVLIFIDLLLDTLLFLVAVFVVKWPKSAIFASNKAKTVVGVGLPDLEDTRVEEQVEEDVNFSEVSFDDTVSTLDLEGGRKPEVSAYQMTADCCLLIACHESTLTREKRAAFVLTLRAAMRVFSPSHIFVCDNGNSPCPVDDTLMVTQTEGHPDINYLYVPEGNKTFAFYWTNRYWIPYLVEHGRVNAFNYAVMIDDDVQLPSDFYIPHEHLRQHSEVKAIHFPIKATDDAGNPGNCLVRMQDVEYKLAAVHKQFQSSIYRCLSAHGAVSLWDREALDCVFQDHDTVFHGEDMFMGLCLLKWRDGAKIISVPQSVVPTVAPCSLSVLFRQRVRSWELTSHRKTLTYIFELLFSPSSWCHLPSLTLKPWFLQEVLTIFLDWLRVFLITSLLFRNWLGLVTLTFIFSLILYVQVVLFNLVILRSRRDLQVSTLSVLLFPWYRLFALVFRLCALCQNLLVYSHGRNCVKISIREDEIKDIPPVPPHWDVDWFTVWKQQQPKKQSK